LRNTVLITIGYIADKFDDILSSVRSNKAFATISDVVGDFIKVIGALITDSSNLIKGAAAGILGKSVLPTTLPDKPVTALPASISDLGKASAAMMEGKAAAGAVEAIPDVVKAADAVGDVGQAAKNVGILGKLLSAFSGFGDLVSGPLRFLGEITDVTAFVKSVGKVLGPIGVIFSIFDGISTATDTEKLQSIFGKFDITMQDRISGFVGGFIGGFGGLFDLLAKLMGIEIEGESIQSSLTKTVTLMTDSIFEGIKSFLQFIGKILTSEPAKAVFGAAKELIGAVADGIGAMFQFFKDVFFSEGFQKVITVLTQIAGSAISGVIDAVKSVVEIVVGLFTLDFTKVKSAVGDLVGTVVTGIQSALAMIGNGIIWAINGLMNTLSLPESWRMSYFEVPGVKGGNMFAGGDQTSATANRTGVELNSQGRTASDPRYAQYAAPSTIIEQQLPNYLDKVIQVESGGRNIANQSGPGGRPTSSAFGIAQITEGTFTDIAKRAKPGSALAGKTFEDMKADTSLQRIALAELTQHNANFLSKKGIPVNESSLYLAHFLGAGGAARAIGASDTDSIMEVVSDKQYAANPMLQKMTTAGDLKRWAEQKMGGANSRQSTTMAISPQQQRSQQQALDAIKESATPAASTPSPQEKREQTKSAEAVQTTATETVVIRRANEEQAAILSDMGMEVEAGTKLQQIHLDKLDAYHRENRAEMQQQTRYLQQVPERLDRFQQERKNLELQFLREVEGDIRGAMTKALGPAGMGVSGQNANMMAYRTYGSLLEKPFTKALTNVFGESGGAYGQIFSKLAGSYINQAASAILPAMGIDPNVFNRALSNYTAGKQVRDQYKVAQTEYNITKAEYDAAAAKVTLADRLNATKPGKINEIKREQIAKVDALEIALQQKGATLDTAGKAKNANKSMYTEDLIFAMTGMPTGIRSMMGYETGQDQLTKQLTMMIGGDVAQSAFGGAGLQEYMANYRQMYERQLQGQSTVAEQSAALQGQVGVNNAEMIHGVNGQFLQTYSNINGQFLQGMGRIVGAMPSGQQSTGGGFLESLGKVGKAVSSVGKFFGFGKESTGTVGPNVNEFGIETFDDGSTIQYFDDGSTLVMDTAGKFSSTDAFTAAAPSFTQTLTNFGSTLTTGLKNIFTPSASTAVGGGGSIPGVRGATMPNKMSPTDIAGNFLGSAISNKLGITGPSAGIVSSGLKDLFGGQGFGKTSSYIQGPGTFGSSLFNIYGLKNANTSSLGGTLNTALNAYQLYNGLASGSMLASAGGLIQSAGSMLGSQTIANFGSGMASGQTSAQLAASYGQAGMSTPSGMSAGANTGAIAGPVMGIIGGHYLGRAISGGYSTGGSGNSMVNSGTAIGAAVGSIVPVIGTAIGALIGGMLGGTVNRLFGRKPKAVTGTGLQVTMGGEQGASGQAYSDWIEKGGKYRSDRSGRDFSAIDPELLKYFGETSLELQKAYGGLASGMGLDPNTIKGFQKYVDISFKGLNQQQSADAIQNAMKQYSRDMISQYGDIGRYAKDLGDGKKEDILDTFQRLSTGASLFDTYSTTAISNISGWMQSSAENLKNIVPELAGISATYESVGNQFKLDLAAIKTGIVEVYGGEEAYSRITKGYVDAIYSNEEKAIYYRDLSLKTLKTQIETAGQTFAPEIQAYLDKFAVGGITTQEGVDSAMDAYQAAVEAAERSGNITLAKTMKESAPLFKQAADISLQAATMNKDAAERTKTADEFFGFTDVQDFSMGIANGIAEAAPQMAEGPASMFDLGSENLTGVVDRSFIAPYYGDGTSISGLVSNAGAGGLGGQSTIVLQPSVIDNSVLSNPSTNIYMDNSAVRDYHPILSIDVRNVTSGYLGLGSK
jgi:hypothetical protein